MSKPIWRPRWYDWIAYWTIMLTPTWRWNWLQMRLLPYAGRWEYRREHDEHAVKMHPGIPND